MSEAIRCVSVATWIAAASFYQTPTRFGLRESGAKISRAFSADFRSMMSGTV
jgi:hypothetical protein